jgi:methylthioribose-1-phosphate isomerase
MNVKDTHYRSVWVLPGLPARVGILDQRRLPHRMETEHLETPAQVFTAIRDMHTRGAPLIGAVAAYGVWLAAANETKDPAALLRICDELDSARPTAVNLAWALERQRRVIRAQGTGASAKSGADLAQALLDEANRIADEDVACCEAIGRHGLALIRALHAQHPDRPVQMLTHCNAGWLATVDWGTATSPMYQAHDAGIPIHVWVDETRPRNQGAQLTAWELGQHGIPHTLIADNAGGHLMQQGQVDLVIVGTDRTTRTGDVANKIGTYLKALAARDNGVPFYVALPSSTIDWSLRDGLRDIPIEARSGEEIRWVQGLDRAGHPGEVLICPAATPAGNPAFDVTPARLVTGLITERGICAASEEGLLALFPEQRSSASQPA